MPYIRAWIHYVWSTKNRERILKPNLKELLIQHIRENARQKNIYLDRINGYEDHLHSLVSLGSGQSIDQVAQLIKGESSFWFNNRSELNAPRLEWQNDYFAVSVCESRLDAVRAYIDNQEIHHQRRTFAEEFEEFIGKFGFQKLG
jgi:REP element-mobilizing transposase RayT